MHGSYQWGKASYKNSRAIAYYRHSAEDKQENSVPIQRELTHKFATQHGIEIIHEEADEGKTGLLADRPGFQRLFTNWILNKEAPEFTYILVYDVSRWGRFQEQDEAGFHQFRCKQEGREVIYVAQGFPKPEHRLVSSLQTSIERYMAAEYSRQLSNKVFYGSAKISQEGYSAGGMACYGLGRLLLDAQKNPIRILNHGEHKQISNERVTFVPLDNEETEIVRDIFNLFVEGNKSPTDIVRYLNKQGFVSATGGKWNRNKVIRILSNEVYAGTRIYNKTWNRLRQGKRKNPRKDWIVCPAAFPAIVTPEIFSRAQEKLYWYTLRQWKGATLALQKARKLVRNRVFDALYQQPDQSRYNPILIDQLPILFGVGIESRKNSVQWCFLLPEEMRQYDYVLAIGVNPELAEPIDHVFIIPTTNFTTGGLHLLTTEDNRYREYLVEPRKIDTVMTTLVNQLVKV